MGLDYQNSSSTQSVARSTVFEKYGHRWKASKAFPPSAPSTNDECVHRLRENPSSAPKQSRFDRCRVRSVSMGSKYPRFLAYCPLVTVINEGGTTGFLPEGVDTNSWTPVGLEFYLFYLFL